MLFVVACAGGVSLEERISRAFSAEFSVEATLACPDDARGLFDCTARVGEEEITVHVVRDADDTFEFQPVGLVASPDAANQLVGAAVDAMVDAEPDTVDCGDDPVVARPGEPFECEIVLLDQPGTVRVTVDETGTVVEVVPI